MRVYTLLFVETFSVEWFYHDTHFFAYILIIEASIHFIYYQQVGYIKSFVRLLVVISYLSNPTICHYYQTLQHAFIKCTVNKLIKHILPYNFLESVILILFSMYFKRSQ